MRSLPRLARVAAAVAALYLTTGVTCEGTHPSFRFLSPQAGQLSLVGTVAATLEIPPQIRPGSLFVTLDGADVSASFAAGAGSASASLAGVAAGPHTLVAKLWVVENGLSRHVQTQVSFETTALDRPDDCEILNDVECFLPYPSSRFLEPAPTPTGYRLNFPLAGMPVQLGQPIDPTPLRKLDGFSPTVQVLMHFPGNVDLAQSNVSRLLEATRTHDLSSLAANHPTVLIDAETGERVLHWCEADARATAPEYEARQIFFLRPARSLSPGRRYVVAVRDLVHADGTPVRPEPAFAALRDGRPTTIPAVEARRAQMEDVFSALGAAGVPRDDLVLAFDFVTQSDAGLTGQMLSMREQAFTWLAAQSGQTFSVTETIQRDCSQAGEQIWRIVRGTYQVPLFLTEDPLAKLLSEGVLNADANGTPVQNGVTNPPFTVALPCSAMDANGNRIDRPPLMLGHGLFGTGRGFVEDVGNALSEEIGTLGVESFDYIPAGTDWWGLSSRDIQGVLQSWIVQKVIFDLSHFDRLPDRLRQGQLNTLVLARMMKEGRFNSDPAFQLPSGQGALPGSGTEMYYFGASLGGIMGLMFSALTPDVQRLNVDVPGINFSLLLQRATPFLAFQDALTLTGFTDPMQISLGITFLHELWVRAEPAGYATHITSDPLPGTNAKNILMTQAFLDQQVSNQATEIAARTLGLPSLVGSNQPGKPGMPDLAGPLDGAFVSYDTGSFDLANPAHTPFIPPLTNVQATPNSCDPHGRRGFIPASLLQLVGFFQPGGRIESFCNGLCDADDTLVDPLGDPNGPRLEIPFGDAEPCNPTP
jgi:hypothetical protein